MVVNRSYSHTTGLRGTQTVGWPEKEHVPLGGVHHRVGISVCKKDPGAISHPRRADRRKGWCVFHLIIISSSCIAIAILRIFLLSKNTIQKLVFYLGNAVRAFELVDVRFTSHLSLFVVFHFFDN